MSDKDREIKELVYKILEKISNIENTISHHSDEFSQLHTELSTYHTEIITISTNVTEIEKDYKDYLRKHRDFTDLQSTLYEHEKSINDFLIIKNQVSNCPHFMKYSESSVLYDSEPQRYIG